jgi:hypothetical protein
MSRIDDLIDRVEANESVDLDRLTALLTLEFASQGEQFADEMVTLIESLDEDHRYRGVESIELFESGRVKAVHFQTQDDEKP